MRRALGQWMSAQHLSTSLTPTAGIERAAVCISVASGCIPPCGTSSLYLTVRRATVTTARKAAAAATLGGRKKRVMSQKDTISLSTEGKHGKCTGVALREEEEEEKDYDAAAVLESMVADGDEVAWGEKQGRPREYGDIGSGEEESDLLVNGRQLSQPRILPNTDEFEDDDEEAVGGATVEDTRATVGEESRLLKKRFPDLAAEYDIELNNEPLDEILVDSARIVSWKCVDCEFKWKSAVFVRACLRTKCPQCEKVRNPGLGSRLIQLWDYSLNDPCVDPKTMTAGSNKSVYWRCPICATSYQARIKDMVAGKARCSSCSLLNFHADFGKDENGLLQEWHPLKNGDLQPSQVKPTDPTKLWWLCMACGHEWEAPLSARLSKSRRTKGKDCPVCNGKRKD